MKSSLLIIIISLALVTMVLLLTTSYPAIAQQQTKNTNKIALLRSWYMFSTASSNRRYPFTAPGTIFGNLVDQNLGFPKNILEGLQLQDVDKKPFQVPWVFEFRSGQFPNNFFPNTSSSTSSSYKYFLRFEGISYKATLKVNNIQLANTSTFVGTFREFTFDITDAVANSGNDLKIELIMTPAVDDVFPPVNPTTDLARTWIDWAPPPPDASTGLWRNVQLIQQETTTTTTKENRILSQLRSGDAMEDPCLSGELRFPQITVEFPESYNGQTTVPAMYENVKIEIDTLFETTKSSSSSSSPSSYDYSLSCQIERKNGKPTIFAKNTAPIKNLANGVTLSASPVSSSSPITLFSDSDIWFPWQMSPSQQRMDITADEIIKQPNFVKLSCSLTETTTQTTCASSIQNLEIGLRQSESKIVRIADNQPVRQFFINKLPILIRGAGWAPELLYRDTAVDYNTTFFYTRAMNLNALRLEGKFPPDSFYEIADRTGVLVLDGFSCCDAFQHWDNWTDVTYFVANETLRYQLRRLRRFASVSTFLYSSDQLPPESVERMYLQTFAAEKWPSVKISSAANVTSNISSFSGVKMSGPYSATPNNYWSEGASKFLLGGAFGFLTEGGPGESPQNFATQLSMTVNHHRTSPDSPTTNVSQLYPTETSELVNYHMGNPAGLFYNLRFYSPFLNNRYGQPPSPYQFAEYSQLVNYASQMTYQEAYNGNKYTSTGYVQWMLNSAWPSNLWNLYSYSYAVGGAFFGAQSANRFLFGGSSSSSFAVVPWYDWSTKTIAIFNGAYTPVQNVNVTYEQFMLTASGADLMDPESKPKIAVDLYSTKSDVVSNVSPDSVQKNILSTTFPKNKNGNNDPKLKRVYLMRLTTTTTSSSSKQRIEKLYWVSSTKENVIEWDKSNFYRSPCSQDADYRPIAQVAVDHQNNRQVLEQERGVSVTACMKSPTLVRVNVTRRSSVSHDPSSFLLLAHFSLMTTMSPTNNETKELTPVLWDDNFITMLPTEHENDKERILHARVLNRGSSHHQAVLFVNLRNISYPISPSC